jgi:hypothetical protein
MATVTGLNRSAAAIGRCLTMRTVCTLALVLVAVPLLLGADFYRWADADGVVNYSQRKPEGVESARMRADTGQRVTVDGGVPAATPASALPAATAAGPTAVTSHAPLENAEATAPGMPSAQELAKQRNELCKSARAVLEQLTSRGRVRVRDEDGTARLLTEDERQERIGQAERSMANHCAGTAGR